MKRYFVGYPKPRLSLKPWAVMGLAAALLQLAVDNAAAAFQPIKKVSIDPVGLSVTSSIVTSPQPPPLPLSICGGLRSPRSYVTIERATDREVVPVGWTEEGFWPARSIRERMERLGLRHLHALFRVCTESEGHIITVSRVEGTGERGWDDWLARKIQHWWDELVDDHAIGPRRGCYILTYGFERF